MGGYDDVLLFFMNVCVCGFINVRRFFFLVSESVSVCRRRYCVCCCFDYYLVCWFEL